MEDVSVTSTVSWNEREKEKWRAQGEREEEGKSVYQNNNQKLKRREHF